VKNSSTLPWMAAGLAAILAALFFLRGDPEPEPVVETPRMATTAARAKAPQMRTPDHSRTVVLATEEQPEADGTEAPEADAAPPENPFEPFLDAPEPLTSGHDEYPNMAELAPDDPEYSPVAEAHQLFAPFEAALIAQEPLDPNKYKALITEFKDQNLKVLKRAEWMRKSGHPDVAGEMIGEWGRLFDHYKAQAYGRPADIIFEELNR
jgi:hypothetical protein